MVNRDEMAFLVGKAIKNYKETGFGMTKYESMTVIADCVPDGMRVAVYDSGLLVQQYVQRSA